MENASGEAEQEHWFEEGGCIELSKMESGSWRDCCQSGVNPATPIYGDKPGSKLELIDYILACADIRILFSGCGNLLLSSAFDFNYFTVADY